MLILIAGQGYVSRKGAQNLISDFVPGEATFVTATAQSDYSDGVENTLLAVEHLGLKIQEHFNPDFFLFHEDKDKMVFVLDQNTEAELVRVFLQAGYPIYDLSRGLYPVNPEMPLDGSVSHAKTLAVDSATEDIPKESKPSPSLSETRVREIVREELALIGVTATDTFGAHRNIPQTEENISVSEHTIKIYRNNKGKLRKAGRSKPRPGETEIWMTEAEYESGTVADNS